MNISELNQYDEGVYLIETTDPVMGGVDGISNKQAKSLANRTNWLKKAYDTLKAAYDAFVLTVYSKSEVYTKAETDQKIADLVASSPATLDTLNELAAALGDDPNFATTMATQLSNKVNKTDIADTTKAGIVRLSTLTESRNGTDNTTALTPNSLADLAEPKILTNGQLDGINAVGALLSFNVVGLTHKNMYSNFLCVIDYLIEVGASTTITELGTIYWYNNNYFKLGTDYRGIVLLKDLTADNYIQAYLTILGSNDNMHLRLVKLDGSTFTPGHQLKFSYSVVLCGMYTEIV